MTEQLNGATRLFPIIGDPIMYAESPMRFTRTLQERNYDGACVPIHVPAEDLDRVMAGLTATLNVDGILITMPHKLAMLAFCATSSERARMLGAISVARRNPDRTWHGDMLDGMAFVKAQRDNGARLEGSRALLVGAGGAGRAIALALLEAGVGELIVYDEIASRVAVLLDLIAERGDDRVRAGPPDPTGCDLVFNATPMGMEEGDPLPVEAALLRPSMFVGDVIAGHGAAPLINAAREVGCDTANGTDMVDAVQDLMAEFMLENQRAEIPDGNSRRAHQSALPPSP